MHEQASEREREGTSQASKSPTTCLETVALVASSKMLGESLSGLLVTCLLDLVALAAKANT